MTTKTKALKIERQKSQRRGCLNGLALLAILLLVCIILYLLQQDDILNIQFDREAFLEQFQRPSPTLISDFGLIATTPIPVGIETATAEAAATETSQAVSNEPTPTDQDNGADPPQEAPTGLPQSDPTAPDFLAVLPLKDCEDFSQYIRSPDEQADAHGWYTMRHYRNLLRAAGLLGAEEEILENGQTIAVRQPDGSLFYLQRGYGLQNAGNNWCPKNFGGETALAQSGGSSTPTGTIYPTFTATPPPQPTATATQTFTATPLPTNTPLPTLTATTTPSATATPSATSSSTTTPTPTALTTPDPAITRPPPPTLDLRSPTPFAQGCPLILVLADGVQIGEEQVSLDTFTDLFNEATDGTYKVILVDGKLLTAHDQGQLENGEATSPGKVIFTLPEGGIRFLEETYCLQPEL